MAGGASAWGGYDLLVPQYLFIQVAADDGATFPADVALAVV